MFLCREKELNVLTLTSCVFTTQAIESLIGTSTYAWSDQGSFSTKEKFIQVFKCRFQFWIFLPGYVTLQLDPFPVFRFTFHRI